MFFRTAITWSQNVTAVCTRIRHILYNADDTALSHDRGGLYFDAGDGHWMAVFGPQSVFPRENRTLIIPSFLRPVNMPSSSGSASGVTGSDTV